MWLSMQEWSKVLWFPCPVLFLQVPFWNYLALFLSLVSAELPRDLVQLSAFDVFSHFRLQGIYFSFVGLSCGGFRGPCLPLPALILLLLLCATIKGLMPFSGEELPPPHLYSLWETPVDGAVVYTSVVPAFANIAVSWVLEGNYHLPKTTSCLPQI